MADPVTYTFGGTVQAGGGVYIPRQADEELLNLCRTATFAYVLTPRQMGKSSLMVRTAEILTQEGISSVIVDLQELGTQVTAEQWFLGFLVKLDDQLLFDVDIVSWWREHDYLGVSQRLTLFFEEILLAQIEGRIVIFVDEIDSTLSLDFTDDFFIAIRYFYTKRATNPEFKRLSFVLLGVATPGDLIRDSKRTPFNIGQRVDLSDFTFEEALPLAKGLGLSQDKAQQVLWWVLKWTSGHPYLTQRLCGAVVKFLRDGRQGNVNSGTQRKLSEISVHFSQTNITEADIKQIVSNTFFGKMSEQDNNLQFVRDMLIKRSPDIEVLTNYRNIRRGKRAVFDEEQSIVKSHLKLSGVVRREKKILRVRNQVYRQVFDDKWLNQHLPLNLRDRWEQLKPALPYVAGLVIFSVLMTGVAAYVNEQRLIAQNARNREQEQRREAENQRNDAKYQAKEAQQEKNRAERERKEADIQKYLAEAQRKRAEQGERQAKSAQKLAEQRRTDLANAFDRTKTAEQVARERQIEAEKQRDFARRQEQEANKAKADVDKRRINAEIFAESLKAQSLLGSKLELDALLAGLSVSKKLKEIYKNVESDSYFLVVATLQQVIYGIKEINRLDGHKSSVNNVAFSLDGKTIVSGSSDNTIRLWNLQGQQLQTFKGHRSLINSVAFSPNGKTIVSGSSDNTIRLWNLQGQELQILNSHESLINSVAFSPNGKTIVSGSSDNTIRLWNLQGQELQIFKGHRSSVNSVIFSPDGKTIASASADNTIRLWNLQGQELKTFKGHRSLVNSVAFSPDGKTIASASADNTVRLWNLQGQELETLDHRNSVNSVTFSPDGKTIASASADNTVRLWNLQGQELETFSKSQSFFQESNHQDFVT